MFSRRPGARFNRGRIPVGSAAAATFDPTAIANLILWLDSRSGQGITQGAGIITAWTDKSAGGHNAIVPVGNEPAYNAANATYNGLPSCDFATTKRFTLPDLGITTGDFSVLYIGHTTNTNADFFGTTDATPLMRCFNSAGTYRFARNGGANPISGGNNANANVMGWSTSGTNQKLYTSAKTPTSNNTGVATDLTGKTLMMGNFGGGVNSLFTQGGPMLQMLVYSRQLSDAEYTTLLNGFGAIYGIAIGA